MATKTIPQEINEQSVVDLLSTIAGLSVLSSDEDRAFFSQDVFRHGVLCAAVAVPTSVEQLRQVVVASARAGHAVIARGGGMSYTGGYLAVGEASVVIDMSRLDAVIEINEVDMYITVQAGCTWAAVETALSPLGLRAPYWGPLSGLRSTVGGAASQNSVFFGSALHGSAADSIIGLSVVLADGSMVTTGSAGGVGANAFSRHYGPDLTGIFTGDAGAFGIKATVTLRLLKRKPVQRYASFSFPDRASLVTAMHKVAHAGLATECFAFDPFLQSIRMKRAGLVSDVKTLAAVVSKQETLGRGIFEGVRMAFAGRRFADNVIWPLHIVVEDRTSAAADAALGEVVSIAAENGGRETENTVPKAVHAAPFGPMNGMIGVEGERWVPVHGVLPNSRTVAFLAAFDSLIAARQIDMNRLRVTTGHLITTVGPGATLVEPVFYWPDARAEIHNRSVDPAFLKRLPAHDENLQAREFVTALRQEVINLFVAYGAIHYQVGKTYPLLSTREDSMKSLLIRLKGLLDSDKIINPGALQLGSDIG